MVKVPHGKLVKVKLTFDDTITAITILGDFFLHPEDALVTLENSLVGLPVTDKKLIIETTQDIIAKHDIQMIGITPEAIAEAIQEAAK